MDVRTVSEAGPWDAALITVSYPPFTQLWAWGAVQEALGKRVVRLRADTPHGAIVAQWVEERRGPLRYWFAPQGPVAVAGMPAETVAAFVEACRAALPGGPRICFLRCEPRWRASSGLCGDGPGLPAPFRRVRSLNPSTSFVVPLRGTPADVFETFHKKTRYNVRLAERHHVVVRGGSSEDLPTFLRLMKETAARDGFRPHDDRYLRTVFQGLADAECGRLRVAEHAGRPLAVNFEVVCGDTVMYLYGASSSEERERMAPYALQWSAIFAATQDGLRWYDFGGGNPEDPAAPDFRPGWDGMTRFKERWGTVRAADPGTWDLPLRPLVYRLLVRR